MSYLFNKKDIMNKRVVPPVLSKYQLGSSGDEQTCLHDYMLLFALSSLVVQTVIHELCVQTFCANFACTNFV